MGAHDDAHAAIGQPGVNLFPLPPGDATGEQANGRLGSRYPLEKATDGLIVLLGQDLGGGHQRCLCAGGHGQSHRRCCHDGLARAYVSLQESVHWPVRAQIGDDLSQRPLLGAGQFEGQAVDEVAEGGVVHRQRFARGRAPQVPLAQQTNL